ncbi:hypothetical protein PM082_004271 [Marasmius tenuissimus]|nr:hypothetical protein PM082_004271 [Marasmius tenuissimus]
MRAWIVILLHISYHLSQNDSLLTLFSAQAMQVPLLTMTRVQEDGQHVVMLMAQALVSQELLYQVQLLLSLMLGTMLKLSRQHTEEQLPEKVVLEGIVQRLGLMTQHISCSFHCKKIERIPLKAFSWQCRKKVHLLQSQPLPFFPFLACSIFASPVRSQYSRQFTHPAEGEPRATQCFYRDPASTVEPSPMGFQPQWGLNATYVPLRSRTIIVMLVCRAGMTPSAILVENYLLIYM